MDPLVKELLARLELVERAIKRSPIETGTVVEVDPTRTDDLGVPHPVRVQIGNDPQALVWLPVGNTGVVPPVGSTVDLVYNQADARIQMRPGMMIDGDLMSSNFPGYGLGGPGWGLSYLGLLEVNDAVIRGLVNASGGPNLLENGDAEVDISGVTESAGTFSRETDTAHTHLASVGAFKLVTASESDERWLDWPIVGIDPNDPLFASAFVKGSNALNRSKIAVRYFEADETFIEEVEGRYVTVGTAFGRIVAKAATPAVATGFTDYRPNEDVAALTSNVAGVSNNTVGQRHQNIDEVVQDPADYVTHAANAQFSLGWRAAVGSGSLAGKTITSVDVHTWWIGATFGADLFVELHLGGTLHEIGGGTASPGQLRELVSSLALNPETGAAWTAAEVEALDVDDAVKQSTNGGGPKFVQSWVRAHWIEDAPIPAKASVRVYLDPEQVAVTTWRVDDVELHTISEVKGALAAGEIDYIEKTTSQSTASDAPVDVTSPAMEVVVVTDGTRRIRLVADAAMDEDTSGFGMALYIREGSTVINERRTTTTGGNAAQFVHVERTITPPAGTHTYKLSFSRYIAGGNAELLATAAMPAILYAEDVGMG